MHASHPSEVATHTGVAGPRPPTRRPWWPAGERLHRLRNALHREVNGLVELLKISPPHTSQVLQRIETMEQHIILPIKAAWIAILLRPATYSWIGEQATSLEVPTRYAYALIWTY